MLGYYYTIIIGRDDSVNEREMCAINIDSDARWRGQKGVTDNVITWSTV